MPHRRDHDEVAKNRCIFAGYKDASGGTLSIKEREKPQRITESQYVEGYVKVDNSKTFTLYSGRSVCSEFPTSGAVVA